MTTTAEDVEVKERPILFSGPMVRAILEGRKTQTRRVVNPQPKITDGRPSWEREDGKVIPNGPRRAFGGRKVSVDDLIAEYCPYGQPGDRLWVREAFAHLADLKTKDPGTAALMSRAFYRQEYPTGLSHDNAEDLRWRSPIHMPRNLSRITLEITNIRVERLREIGEADAIAEGVRQLRDGSGTYVGREGPGNLVTPWLTAREAFADVWDSINTRRGYSWISNPWVWVIEFKKL